MNFTIPVRKTTRVLTVIVLYLMLASVIGQSFKFYLNHANLLGFVPLFDVNIEGNIPTYYSSMTLLFCSILLGVIAYAKKINGGEYIFHWRMLSFIFLYLSLDEAAGLHDLAGRLLGSALDTRGVLYYAWVIPGTVLVVITGLAYLRFLADLPAKTRHLFLVAGTLFVGGALGMELAEGWFDDLHGVGNITTAMLTTVEEFCEMIGIVVFIHALLSYISLYVEDVQFCVETEPVANQPQTLLDYNTQPAIEVLQY